MTRFEYKPAAPRAFICFALAAALCAGNAFAFDFGLTVSNDSDLSGGGGGLALSQADEAVLWLSLPVGASSSIYASAVYEFSGDFTYRPAYADSIRWYSITAGRVEWEGFVGLSDSLGFGWSVGRIPLQDYSGRVVNGLLDGAAARLSIGQAVVSAAVAYTGLTFKEDALILIDSDDETAWSDDEVDLAPRRLVASLGARLVEVLPFHDLGVDGWAQFDLGAAGETATHTQYAEPFIEGRVGRSIRWRLWGAAEFGQDPDFFYGMAAGARVRLSVPELAGLRVTATGSWAGGDYDGDGGMRTFTPITTGSLSSVAGTMFSDALGASIDASFVPMRGLTIGAGGDAHFRPGADGAQPYLGLELSGGVDYEPASDVTLAIEGGCFIPNEAADPGASFEWLAAASATLRL